jgi:adenylate kinase family enzyme
MSFAERYTQAVRAHYQGDEGAFAEISRAIATGIPYQSIRKRLESMVDDGYPRRVRMLQEQKKALAGGQGRSPQTPSRVAGTMNALQRPPEPPRVVGNDLLQELTPQSFEELLLPEGLKAQFNDILLELEYRDELAARNLRARDRILLYGAPGNGKTSSAASLAHALGIPAYGVNLARLQGSHLGETAQNLARLFASMHKDTLVVFDEIDAIGGKRTEDTQAAAKEQNSVVNTLLTMMDREGSGIIVATTNRQDILDDALRRRFEEVLEVPPPTGAQKNALAERLCGTYQVATVHVDDCENYDAVTKRCKREARRIVMQEILAKEAKADD